MTNPEQLYPPSPTHVPPELTAITTRYRLRVLATLAGLGLFLVLYVALLYAAFRVGAWIWSIEIPPMRGRAYVLAFILKFGSLAAVVLLFLFLLRPLFKRRPREREEGEIELTVDSAPTFFWFLERLCEEIGAPMPRRVFVGPDTGARIGYDITFLNLFVPPTRDLYLGLGAVNLLNLSELKATLAHELGHASQRATWLGRHVHVAARAVYELFLERDRLDELLDKWRGLDLRLSLPAWILWGVLKLTRWLLRFVYKLTLRAHRSLLREAEFNADAVAVSVAGSDAIVHVLYKLEVATECMELVSSQLMFAADNGIYTDDLFYHQMQIIERQRRRRRDPRWGLPPELPDDPEQASQVFEPTEEDFDPDPYSTHPTDFQREQHAKKHYIRCPLDERSAWLVFDNARWLRRTVTQAFYRDELNKMPEPLRPAREVQSFIEAELVDQEALERYGAIFTPRYYFPGDPRQLAAAPPPPDSEIATYLEHWPDRQTLELAEEFAGYRRAHRALLDLIAEATVEGIKTLQTKEGKRVPLEEVIEEANQVEQTVLELEEQLHEADLRFLRMHLAVARAVDEASGGKTQEVQWLVARVELQQALDKAADELNSIYRGIPVLIGHLRTLDEKKDEDPEAARTAAKKLAEHFYTLRQRLKDVCRNLQSLRLPRLPNVPPGSTAHDVVVAPLRIRVPRPSGPFPTAEEMVAVSGLAQSMLPRLHRLQSKTLAALIKHCERLATLWRQQQRAAQQASATRPDGRSAASAPVRKRPKPGPVRLSARAPR